MKARLLLLLPFLLVVSATGAAPEEASLRPLLVTVDERPIAGGGHDNPAERRQITDWLLGHLERHGIQAVGFVTWSNVRDVLRGLSRRHGPRSPGAGGAPLARADGP